MRLPVNHEVTGYQQNSTITTKNPKPLWRIEKRLAGKWLMKTNNFPQNTKTTKKRETSTNENRLFAPFITRLRIGHTVLTHKYIKTKEQSPKFPKLEPSSHRRPRPKPMPAIPGNAVINSNPNTRTPSKGVVERLFPINLATL